MKPSKILILFLAALHSISAIAALPVGKTIRFRKLGNQTIAIPVLLNGRGPFQFVLDTGTDSSIMDARLANEVGLERGDQVTLFTVAGQKNVSRAYVQTVTVGAAVGTNLEVLTMNLDSAFPDRNVRGVLGQNFLRTFDVFLDNGAGTVTLLSPGDPVPVNGVAIPITFEHDRPAVVWKFAAQREIRLLLDSGSSSLTFFRDDIPNFHRCIFDSCRQAVTTTVSAVTVFSGVLSSFVIGNVCLHDIPAVYSTQSPPGDRIDGMLPTGIFHSVYINNHQGFAIFCGSAP